MEAGIVEIFFSFVSEESNFYHKLRQQLSQLERDGRIRCWSREDISAGEEPEHAIQAHLASATIIVLLVSPAYVESDKYYQEARKAMERRQEGKAHVLPVLLKPGLDDYKNTPFGELKPAHEKPITLWSNQDQAFTAIAESIMQTAFARQKPEIPLNQSQLWAIPYPRNSLFTGRETELRAIADALRAGQNAAISGLGGIGKSQTALEYACRHRDEYRYVFWAIADTREKLNDSYRKIAEQLDLPGKSQTEQRYIVEAARSWLAAHSGWLLILDNADDLSIVPDYLPITFSGHVLLTTRAHAMGRLAQRIEIKRLGSDEGSRFLLRRCGFLGQNEPLEQADPSDLTFARQIVSELAGLPLALDQAGAYIEETSSSLADYLDLYRAYHADLLQARGGFLNGDHPEAVATTWRLSFERVEKANPAAADLLRICAFLAPDNIPEIIITEGASGLTPGLQELAVNPLKLNTAIAELQKYSLIERASAKKTLDVHRLVQVYLRDAMTLDEERAWAERTVRALAAVFPWPEMEAWETCRQLLPHGQSCAALIEQWQMESVEEDVYLLICLGSYLYMHAEYRKAQIYLEEAWAIAQKILGQKHPYTLNSMSDLADVYDAQGKYDDALDLYSQVLDIQRAVLGERDLVTVGSMSDLAGAYANKKKYDDALALYSQALDIRRSILGELHADTARSLHSMASVYDEQGKYDNALALYQRALTIQRQTLNEHHPDIIRSLGNIAFTYYEQKKYAEAEDLSKQALEDHRTILGKTHPDTARILDTLACVYKGQGRYAEALPLFKEAWDILQDRLGPEHPSTKTARNNYEETLRLMEEKEQGGQDI